MAKVKVNKWRKIKPDPIYESVLVSKFINHVMKNGKKTVAMRIVYDALNIIREKMGTEPYPIFEKAIENVKPKLEVKTKRIGGANYQIPVEVRPERKVTLAIRWILDACRSRKGRPMAEKIADEIMAAYRNEGTAIKTKINVHKMAEANKVFAFIKW